MNVSQTRNRLPKLLFSASVLTLLFLASLLEGHSFSRAAKINQMSGALQAAENLGFGLRFERARLQPCRICRRMNVAFRPRGMYFKKSPDM
jgi:hypothetical protein